MIALDIARERQSSLSFNMYVELALLLPLLLLLLLLDGFIQYIQVGMMMDAGHEGNNWCN